MAAARRANIVSASAYSVKTWRRNQRHQAAIRRSRRSNGERGQIMANKHQQSAVTIEITAREIGGVAAVRQQAWHQHELNSGG